MRQQMPPETDSSDDTQDATRKGVLGPLQVIGSTLAAGLGVQSSKNRERDFNRGKLSTFIAAGLTFTIVFIATLYFIVSMVLKNAGH